MLLPHPVKLFTARASRFRQLAEGHTLGEYLLLLGHLAAAQAAAAGKVKVPAPRSRLALERPHDAALHDRHPAWRDVLGEILLEVFRTAPLSEEGRSALEMIAAMPPPELEALADAVVETATKGADLAAGPFVAAALQVYFSALAASLDPEEVAPGGRTCPVCGALPVVGLLGASNPEADDGDARHLLCSLCATRWPRETVRCVACGEAGKLALLAPDEDRTPLRVEACESCKAYLKLFDGADAAVEPFADDAATLAVDLKMAERGWRRRGVNLFLLPDAEAPEEG